MSAAGEVFAAVVAVTVTLFVIAWFTILPMLGLLYVFGWLK